MPAWLDRLRAFFVAPPEPRPEPTVPTTGTDADVDVLFTSSEQAASYLELRLQGGGARGRARGEPHACGTCSAPLSPVLLTTWSSPAWRGHPLVMDGWRCADCGAVTVPAFLTPEQATVIGNAGAAAARNGDLDTAEFHSRRVATSWFGYPPASMNLASVYIDRLRAAPDAPDAERWRRIIETELRIAASGDPVPHPFVHEALARALAQRGADAEARQELARLRRHPDAGTAEAAAADDLERWIDGAWLRYERGTAKISPHMLLDDVDRDCTRVEARKALEEGTADLEAFAALHDDHWQSRWFLGKAAQALGRHERALHWFEQSYTHGHDNPTVCREYGTELLVAGRGSDAVTISRRAVELVPDDATNVVNLAVSLLVAGEIAAARATIDQALAMDAEDSVGMHVSALVRQVELGRRAAPTRLLPGGRIEN